MKFCSIKSAIKKMWKVFPVSIRSAFVVYIFKVLIPKAKNPVILPTSPVFVVGFFRAPTGLGQSARLYYNEMLVLDREVYAVDLTGVFLQDPIEGIFNHPCILPQEIDGFGADGVIVVHVNPPFFTFALFVLRKLLPGKRIVAYWAWELMDVPFYWRSCIPFVDSIEVPSFFTASAICRHTNKTVVVHPHCLPTVEEISRSFAEDGSVHVLLMFDMASNFYRKNPLAAIEAFKLAFGVDFPAKLFIKISSLALYPVGKKKLFEAVQGWPNIIIIDEVYGVAELRELYKYADIYISLHCSEGYGLTMHEAIQYGLYVVATGWSGNMDFMNTDKSRVVPYALKHVDDLQGAFVGKGGKWAAADIVSAARIMRDIVVNERPDMMLSLPCDVDLRSHFISHECVAVIVVNYRSPEYTLACLSALSRLCNFPYKIVVVDNGSGDMSANIILAGWRDLSVRSGQVEPVVYDSNSKTIPDRMLLVLEKNHGFAGANNIAINVLRQDVKCRAFWLLNNDSCPLENALDELCDRLNIRSDSGMASSLIVSMDDKDTVQCAGGGKISKYTGVTSDIQRGATLKSFTKVIPEVVESELSFLTGVSLLIKREVVDSVGLMESDYFLYYEDVDFSLRVVRSGYSLVFCPSSIVLHKEGGSSKIYSLGVDYLCLLNRLKVMRRFFPQFLFFSIIRHFLSIIPRLFSPHKNNIHVVFVSFFDFVTQNKRKVENFFF